jgi:putative ABC transport system substrate-binding protein
MRRRDFIASLAGAMVSPLETRAQPAEQMRRIGIIMNTAPDDRQSQLRLAAFTQTLVQAGWVAGRNLQIEIRWSQGTLAQTRRHTAELARLPLDLILVGGRAAVVVPEIQQAKRGVPVVFVQAVDPVGVGYVKRLARPGGNATGFIQFEYTLAGKWLQLLKDVAPNTTHVAILREPGTAGIGQWAVIQAAAAPLAVELMSIDTLNPDDIERDVSSFASEPNGGLIVAVSSTASVHRTRIINLAAKHRLPAIYPYRYYAAEGGLTSYGPDLLNQFRKAAGYVDRIFKGEKPGDLPVQAPTKYELVINLKTAKDLGLTMPPSLLARADEVIE